MEVNRSVMDMPGKMPESLHFIRKIRAFPPPGTWDFAMPGENISVLSMPMIR